MTAQTVPDIVQRYRQIIDVSREIASTLSLHELLSHIMQAGIQICNAQEASILLYNPQLHRLFFQAATNLDSEKQMAGLVVPEESLAGWVARNRQPLIVSDVHGDDRWFKNVGDTLHFETHSLIAVPLIMKDQLIGVLEVLNKREGAFNDEDQELLVVLASQAAVGIQNARLFEQTDMISEMIHELRTPLSSIGTIAYMLQRPGITEEQRISLAHTIRLETTRLNTLTSTFLDYARLEAGRTPLKWASVPIHVLLKECAELIKEYAHEQSVEIELDLPASIPPIQGDYEKMKQVALNLLSNAIKYNRPAGKVTVRAGCENDYVWWQVEDTGIGIRPEAMKHLFERFYRDETGVKLQQGTGLGLSICKRIIDLHTGQIEVQSTLGQGSCFKVLLPR